MAVKKPNGGIRPIAIGTILRKLISATLSKLISPQLPDFFCPFQYGVGVSGGAENVVQGLRIARALSGNQVVAEIDFTNAFNTVERSVIAEQVTRFFPQLTTWFELCYGNPSRLLVRHQNPLSSERGVQQGDPLGPFLFALALQPALAAAAEAGRCFVMAYLDDVYICGKPDSVVLAASTLLARAKEAGLSCNLSKCWATREINIDGTKLKHIPNPDVLGVPLDPEQRLPPDMVPKKITEGITKLSDVQVALHLLRYVHNSTLTYSFRLSSGQASKDLARGMMQNTRNTLCKMLDIRDIPASSWQQALLPLGPGLGFTDLEAMAPYMAYSSVIEVVSRLAGMDRGPFQDFRNEDGWAQIRGSPIYKLYFEGLDVAKTTLGDDMRSAKLQNLFATRVVEPKMKKEFLENPRIPPEAKAIVKTTEFSPIARQFLRAVPTNKYLSLSSREMRISLSLLLGIPLKMKAKYCDCSRSARHPTPLTMYHALSCKKHAGLILRHELVKDVLVDICKAARLSCEVEPHQAFNGDRKRPDLLVRLAFSGRDTAYDLTIHSPLRDRNSIETTIRNEQAFLKQADNTKRNKYQQQCDEKDTLFVPIVLSAVGGVLEESYQDGISLLINKINKNRFAPPNWAAPNRMVYWLQRIAIALWEGNARKVARFLENKPKKY